MNNFRDVIDSLGGVAVLAEKTGNPYQKVRKWYERDRIAAGSFVDVVRVAKNLGKAIITIEYLHSLCDKKVIPTALSGNEQAGSPVRGNTPLQEVS